MKKQKFKIGDRVKIIKPVSSALWAAGKTGRVIDNDNTPYVPYLVVIDEPPHTNHIIPCRVWCAEIELLEPRTAHPVIVITTDGKTVTAVKRQGKTIITRGDARCNDSDEFDFNVGAALAFARCIGAKAVEKARIEDTKPQLFSGKIICVESDEPNWWTPGKIYEVKDGAAVDDVHDHLTGMHSVDELNTRMRRCGYGIRFIPYVE